MEALLGEKCLHRIDELVLCYLHLLKVVHYFLYSMILNFLFLRVLPNHYLTLTLVTIVQFLTGFMNFAQDIPEPQWKVQLC